MLDLPATHVTRMAGGYRMTGIAAGNNHLIILSGTIIAIVAVMRSFENDATLFAEFLIVPLLRSFENLYRYLNSDIEYLYMCS